MSSQNQTSQATANNAASSPSKTKKKSSTTRKSTRRSSHGGNGHPSYLHMALTAIYNQSYFGKSVTRPAIANYIKSNFKVPEVNVLFNISLRKALAEGVNHGYLDNGETSARFKLNDKGRVYVHEKKLPSKQISGTKKTINTIKTKIIN